MSPKMIQGLSATFFCMILITMRHTLDTDLEAFLRGRGVSGVLIIRILRIIELAYVDALAFLSLTKEELQRIIDILLECYEGKNSHYKCALDEWNDFWNILCLESGDKNYQIMKEFQYGF